MRARVGTVFRAGHARLVALFTAFRVSATYVAGSGAEGTGGGEMTDVFAVVVAGGIRSSAASCTSTMIRHCDLAFRPDCTCATGIGTVVATW